MKYLKELLLLTKKTVPSGTESNIIPLLQRLLGFELECDRYGNYYTSIGDNPETLFCAHLDTVGDKQKEVTHKIVGNFLSTDEKTILGADNKAGVTILIHLIRNKKPGLYYFFINEEIGCLGSSFVRDYDYEKLKNIKRAIAFDRKERGSIVNFMRNRRCCSDEFANTLSEELSKLTEYTFRKDPTGVSADTASFIDIIPECTNISAGGFDEHNNTEKIDLHYFYSLINAVLKINWDNLPIKRNPSVGDIIPSIKINLEYSDDDLMYSSIFQDIDIDLSNIYSKLNDTEIYYLDEEEEKETKEIFYSWKNWANLIETTFYGYDIFPIEKIKFGSRLKFSTLSGKIIYCNITKDYVEVDKYRIHSKRQLKQIAEVILGIRDRIKKSTFIKQFKYNDKVNYISSIEKTTKYVDSLRCCVNVNGDKYYFYFEYNKDLKLKDVRIDSEHGRKLNYHIPNNELDYFYIVVKDTVLNIIGCILPEKIVYTPLVVSNKKKKKKENQLVMERFF